MKISQDGINLITSFEGCKLVAYKCPAGVWTIGYGHTKNVKQGDVITKEKAERFLRSDIATFEKAVMNYDDKYHWTQNEFDALVSFAYNVGSITQLVSSGRRRKDNIPEAILLYNKAKGQVLPGLVRRRQAEQDLFLKESVLRTLKKGSTGADVKYLQQMLKDGDYYEGKIDGQFGSKTQEAVLEFQQCYELAIDGIVGAKTWKKLTEKVNKKWQ